MSRNMRLPVIKDKKQRQRGSRRLLLLLFVFFVTVFIILFLNSSLSKISSIEVERNQFTSVEEIEQTSGIQIGDNFFLDSSNTIEERIGAIKIVDKVEVTKKFPGRIKIEVYEFPNVAYQITNKGIKEAILANGSIVKIPNQQFVIDKPILTGWADNDPIKNKLSMALASIPEENLTDISEIKPDFSDTYPDKIKLYTSSHFEVITTVKYLAAKLNYLKEIMDKLKDKDIHSGVLTLLEADTHTPFEANSSELESDKP